MFDTPDYVALVANKFRPILGLLGIKQNIPPGAGNGVRNYTNAKLASRARKWDRHHHPLKVMDVVNDPTLARDYKRKAEVIDTVNGDKSGKGWYVSDEEITEGEEGSTKTKKTDSNEDDLSKKTAAQEKKQKTAAEKKRKFSQKDDSDEKDGDKKKPAPRPSKKRKFAREKDKMHPDTQSADGEDESEAAAERPARRRQLVHNDGSEANLDGNEQANQDGNATTKRLPAKPGPSKLKPALAANVKDLIEKDLTQPHPEGVARPIPLLPSTLEPSTMQPTIRKKRTKRKATTPPQDGTSVSSGDINTTAAQARPHAQMPQAFLEQMMGSLPPDLGEEEVAAWRAYIAAGPPHLRRNDQTGEFKSDAPRKRFCVSPARASSLKLAASLMKNAGTTHEDDGNLNRGGKLLTETENPDIDEPAGFVAGDGSDGVGSPKSGDGEPQAGIEVPVSAKEKLKGRALRIENHKEKMKDRKITVSYDAYGVRMPVVFHEDVPKPHWLDHYPHLRGPNWQPGFD